MSYAPSDAYSTTFTTSNPSTGAAVNADSLPVATANHNGTDDGTFTLTVSNIATGVYTVTGTVPSGYVTGDAFSVRIAATVSAIAAANVIDRAQIDTHVATAVTDLNTLIPHAFTYDGTPLPKVDVANILGTPSAGTAGYMAPDWGRVNAATSTVDLTNTTIKGVDGVTLPATVAAQSDVTGSTSTLAADISAGTTAVESAITSATSPLATGANLSAAQTTLNTINTNVDSVETVTNKFVFDGANNVKSTPQTTVTVGTNNDKSGYSLAVAPPTAAAIAAVILASPSNLLVTDSNGRVQVQPGTGTGQLNLASGRIGINWGDVLNPATTQVLSGTTINVATSVTNGVSVSGTLSVNVSEIGSLSVSVPGSGSIAFGNVVGTSVYGGGDTSGTTTLLARVPTFPSSFSGAIFPTTLIAAQTDVTGAVSTIDSYITSATSALSTAAALTSAITSINAHTDSDVSALALQSSLSTALTDLASVQTILSKFSFDGSNNVKANAEVVSDKTGYSLTVTPPTAAAIATAVLAGFMFDGSGNVKANAETVSDKSGYALSVTPPTLSQIQALFSFDGAGNVKSIVEAFAAGQDPATWVWNALLASFDEIHTFGAFVQSISGGSGGGGGGSDPWLADLSTYSGEEAGAFLLALYAKIMAASPIIVNNFSNISSTGELTVERGRGYLTADNDAFNFTYTGANNLVAASTTVQLFDYTADASIGTATVTGTQGAFTVTIQFTSTQSQALALGVRVYEVQWIDASSNVVPLFRGVMSVVA